MFLHLFRIDLVIFLLCFAISIVIRGYIPSSLPWFADIRFKSSCLLVFTYSLHQCFKTVTGFVSDCILCSYLTFVIEQLSAVWLTLGSCSSRVIASALVLCICLWYRQSWATYLSSCNLNCYWLAVTPRTSWVRFFCSCSKHLWVGPLVSLWTFNKFWLWLVVQVGDTVVALHNQRLPAKECNWPVPVKKWIDLVCMSHQY